MQSEAAKTFLKTQSVAIQNTDSIMLVTDLAIYSKSTAVLKIATQVKGFWFLMAAFYIIPTSFRDTLYSIIAKRRYIWFGKLDSCRIPTNVEKNRFLV